MKTYEVKIQFKGQTYTEIWTLASADDAQFNADTFYGSGAVVNSVRQLRIEANA